ncbi:GDYXXLXY domain-containing protein [Propionivibrio limicola]|uniref:GDYXXLXY domain-containing protein n=1 Tax=Propionivibrio limicola TaxID=167645 RepID=UPI0012917ACE|nr:GDYXXLXY domain-containing protein [Propionivibrio limicola]
MKRSILIWLGLAIVLGGAGWGVWSNERILAEGRTVLLELAPVDPRSLMQGDYMALNYALNNEIGSHWSRADGYAVLRLDANGVASLVRTEPGLPAADSAPADDEMAIRYRVRNHQVRIATNAFFFQEGGEPRYRLARYGEFRVGPDGEPRLVALRDADLKRLGENRF